MSIAQCPVCLEVVKDIKVLPTCFHTLCRGCADSLTSNDSIDCPLCQTNNMLTEHPTKQVQAEKSSHEKNLVKCESEDGRVATVWCEKCDYCCCEECWSQIHSIGKFKTHTKLSLEERNQVPKCQIHHNRCEYYCKNCSDFICHECCDEFHTNEHNIDSIPNCAAEMTKNLMEAISSNFGNQICPIKSKFKQLKANIKRNENAIERKQRKIENLIEENKRLQNSRREQNKVLEQAKANRKLLKQLLHKQKPVHLLDPSKLTLLESQISDTFSSIFKTRIRLNLPFSIESGKIKFSALGYRKKNGLLTNPESNPTPFRFPPPYHSKSLASWGSNDVNTNFTRGLDSGRSERKSNPTQTVEKFNASLVKELGNEAEFTPGQIFNRIWVIKNTGSSQWPSGSKFKWIGGDRLINLSPSTITKQVLPGEEVEIDMTMEAPKQPGKYCSYYTMAYANWQTEIQFGDRVCVEIAVKEIAQLVETEKLNLHETLHSTKQMTQIDRKQGAPMVPNCLSAALEPSEEYRGGIQMKPKALKLSFVYVPDAPELPTKYQIEIAKTASIAEFKAKVSALVGENQNNFVVTDVSADRSHILQILEDFSSVGDLYTDSIPHVYFVEATKPIKDTQDFEQIGRFDNRLSATEANEKVRVIVTFKREVRGRHQHLVAFGQPLIVTIKSNISYGELYDTLVANIKRYFSGGLSIFPDDLFVIKITDKNGVQEPRLIEEDSPFHNMDTLVLIFSEQHYVSYFAGPQFPVKDHSLKNV